MSATLERLIPMASASSLFERGDVKTLFDNLVPRYDRFNQISSLGLDRRWRSALVQEIPLGASVLDVGTGTGDTAILASARAERVAGTDLSDAMIEAARRKAASIQNIQWNVADASNLPFKDQSFGVVTSSFVLRNLHRLNLLRASFKEARRVLERGGRFLALDLTRPANPLMSLGHQIYIETFLPLVGNALFGKRWPGAYLKTSIREFPETPEILRLLQETGFSKTFLTPLSGGIAGIFSATRT